MATSKYRTLNPTPVPVAVVVDSVVNLTRRIHIKPTRIGTRQLMHLIGITKGQPEIIRVLFLKPPIQVFNWQLPG